MVTLECVWTVWEVVTTSNTKQLLSFTVLTWWGLTRHHSVFLPVVFFYPRGAVVGSHPVIYHRSDHMEAISGGFNAVWSVGGSLEGGEADGWMEVTVSDRLWKWGATRPRASHSKTGPHVVDISTLCLMLLVIINLWLMSVQRVVCIM